MESVWLGFFVLGFVGLVMGGLLIADCYSFNLAQSAI